MNEYMIRQSHAVIPCFGGQSKLSSLRTKLFLPVEAWVLDLLLQLEGKYFLGRLTAHAKSNFVASHFSFPGLGSTPYCWFILRLVHIMIYLARHHVSAQWGDMATLMLTTYSSIVCGLPALEASSLHSQNQTHAECLTTASTIGKFVVAQMINVKKIFWHSTGHLQLTKSDVQVSK